MGLKICDFGKTIYQQKEEILFLRLLWIIDEIINIQQQFDDTVYNQHTKVQRTLFVTITLYLEFLSIANTFLGSFPLIPA